MKIIGLTGMASCGKSTLRAGLVYYLKKQGYKVADIHEVPRAHYGPINKDTTELSQVTMLSEQIKLFIHFITNNSKQDFIITDRTPMDYLAYSKYYKIPYRHWIPVVEYYTNLYDRIYYILGTDKMENDGVRNTNQLAEATIAGYLEEMLFSNEQIASKTKIIRNYTQNLNIVEDIINDLTGGQNIKLLKELKDKLSQSKLPNPHLYFKEIGSLKLINVIIDDSDKYVEYLMKFSEILADIYSKYRLDLEILLFQKKEIGIPFTEQGFKEY